MLVSATLTPSVLTACKPWCPDLQPLYVGAQPAEALPGDVASPPAGAAGTIATQGSAQSPPQWGWDSVGEQPLRE